MLRSVSTLMLILAGGALAAMLFCLLALRLVVSAALVLTGIRRRAERGQVLSW